MKNANAENKKPNSGKIAGLTVLEVLFYILSLPLIVILSAVFCVKTYELVPYYSFWPFVGVILAGVLCLVFVIVVMCISLRKKSKRSILMQTVSVIIAAVMLTSFIAVVLDVVLPDVLAQLTSSTLFYEDLGNEDLASEQAEFNAQLDRKFIMLNLLNGNYDPNIYYDDLKNDRDVRTAATGTHASNIYYYVATDDRAGYDEYYFSDPLYKELYDFIYENYVMTDPEYALGVFDTSIWSTAFRGYYEGFGYIARLAMAHAITEAVYERSDFENRVKEGMTNERIAELYANNYASLKNDGYLTYDDSMILYATTGRMTVPVVIRLLLDQNYTYTDGEKAYIENGEVVEPEGTFYLELYEPEEVIAVVEANAVEWNDDESKGVLIKKVDGVNYGEGAVIIPVYDEEGKITGGYIRAPRKWSILDMDGKNMDVTAISDVVVDLGALITGLVGSGSSINIGAIMNFLKDLIGPQTLAELLQNLDTVIPALIGMGEVNFVTQLLQAVTEVIMEATGGSGLYLNLCVNDAGDLEISISPTNVEVGMHGYQYMTWMESNNLLFAVISVMSLREWLYIFGAVSVLMAFAAGMCREIKARVRKDIEDNAKKEEEESAASDDAAGDSTYGGEEESAAEAPAEDNVFPETPADTSPEPDVVL